MQDFDDTLISSHSEKQGAAPTYQRGFGFHPLLVYLDATGETLAGLLRPGNAGSNTTADHVEVLDAALAQLPVDPHRKEVVARADSAALTHGFVDPCRERGVRFSIGHDLTDKIRTAVLSVPDKQWVPAISPDGATEREHAEVAEITDLADPTQDLLAWTKLLCLDGELARAEPKRLRYMLWHTAGVIVRSGRRISLRLSDDWPWATQLVAAFDRLHTVRLRV